MSEPKKFRVLATQTNRMQAYVEADTKQEAEEAAKDLDTSAWEFEDVLDNPKVISVEHEDGA